MREIFGSAVTMGLCLWALPHVGSVTPQNEYAIAAAILWFLLAGSALKLTISLIFLPFPKGRK